MIRSDEESSTRGQELVGRAFPAGADVPNTVLVPNPNQADEVREVIQGVVGYNPKVGDR